DVAIKTAHRNGRSVFRDSDCRGVHFAGFDQPNGLFRDRFPETQSSLWFVPVEVAKDEKPAIGGLRQGGVVSQPFEAGEFLIPTIVQIVETSSPLIKEDQFVACRQNR